MPRRPRQPASRILLGLTVLGAALLGWWGRRHWLPTPERAVSRGAEVRQWSSRSCGPAALATVCNVYGRPWTIRELEAACSMSPLGTSLDHLRDAARAHGLHAEALRATVPAGLLRVPRPFVAYLARGHFVVVERYRAGAFELYDPTHDQVTRTSTAGLYRDSSGWVLSVTDGGVW